MGRSQIERLRPWVFRWYDEIRRAELCAALEEPDAEIIWCARGGSGMNRIIGPVLEHAASAASLPIGSATL